MEWFKKKGLLPVKITFVSRMKENVTFSMV